MSKFKKISLILLICGLIASTCVGLWASRAGIYSNGAPTEFKRVILNPGQNMGQIFRANLDNLNKIEFLTGYSDEKIEGLFFMENTQGESLRDGAFEMRKNKNIIEITFEPIEKSRDQLFYVYLQPASDALGTIGLLESGESTEGNLRINHNDADGDLAIRLGYQVDVTPAKFISTIGQRMSQYKPAWMKTPYLYIIWGLFFVSVIKLMVMMIEEFFKDQPRR